MCTREPRLVLGSLVIGWKNGARTLTQSLSEVIINQSNSLITFDTQLKTTLLEKRKGLYQNRVTVSLASILRPGNLAITVKWRIIGNVSLIGVWLANRSNKKRNNFCSVFFSFRAWEGTRHTPGNVFCTKSTYRLRGISLKLSPPNGRTNNTNNTISNR